MTDWSKTCPSKSSIGSDSTLNAPIAENRYRRPLEAAPDGIVEADASGRIVLVNSQAERLFGHQREELLGKSGEMLMPQRFRERHPVHRVHYHAQGGFSVIRELRSDTSFHSLTVVAVMAGAMLGERERALAAGFDSYIAKPIDLHEVEKQVELLSSHLPRPGE